MSQGVNVCKSTRAPHHRLEHRRSLSSLNEPVPGGLAERQEIGPRGGIIGPQFNLFVLPERLRQLDDGRRARLSPRVGEKG